MKRIARIVVLVMAVFALIVTLSSCVKIDQEKVERFGKEAAVYYCEKYSCTAEVVDSKAVLGYSLFAYDTGNIVATMSDGTLVLYRDDTNLFYDDRQSADICDALDTVYIPMLVTKVGLPNTISLRDDKELGLSYNTYTLEEGESDFAPSFFHERYTGDIEAFAAKESMYARGEITIAFSDSQLANPDNLVAEGKELTSLLLDAFGQSNVLVALKASDGSVPDSHGYRYLSKDGHFAEISYSLFRYYKFLDSGVGFSFAFPKSEAGIHQGDITLTACARGGDLVEAALDERYETQLKKAETDNTVRTPKRSVVRGMVKPVYEVQISNNAPRNNFGNVELGIAPDTKYDGHETYLISADGSEFYKVSRTDDLYTVSVDPSHTYYLWRGDIEEVSEK